jgi:hypothetical protein
MTDDPDTQADGLDRLTELAKHASPEGRRLERTIAVVAQSRRARSMSCKTVQQAREKLTSIKQGTLLTEFHSMDEERRSLAELHILKGRVRK